jgi:hypothetical protein
MKWLAFILALGACVGQARAGMLTFDDLKPQTNHPPVIPNGYGGFNWSNFFFLDGSTIVPSGYSNGTVSARNVAFNGFGNRASMGTTGSLFNFVGAYLTGAWHDGLTIEVEGFGGLKGTKLYDTTVTVNSEAAQFYTFNYNGIDTLDFIASGGVNPGYFDGDGTQFAMDNLVTTPTDPPPAATPEPATLLLAGLGASALGGGTWWRRRRTA